MSQVQSHRNEKVKCSLEKWNKRKHSELDKGREQRDLS